MELQQHDVLRTGPSNNNCLRVLPLGKNKTQKVAVGEISGVLHCWSMKKMVLDTSFKSMSGDPVHTLTLGLQAEQDGRIFVGRGRTLQGITKKGKEFFSYETGLQEDVRALRVDGSDIHVLLSQSTIRMHQSDRGRMEEEEYLGAQRLTAFDVAPVVAGQPRWTVAGTTTGQIKVLRAGDVYYETDVEGPVTAVAHNHASIDTLSGNRYAGSQEMVYGCENGAVGQLLLSQQAMKHGWAVTPKNARPAAVTHVDPCPDVNRDGMPEVVVARENGLLEVYAKDDMEGMECIFQGSLNEGAAAIDHGRVTTHRTEEIVVHTSSGRIVAMGVETMGDRFAGAGDRLGKMAAGVAAMRAAAFGVASASVDETRGLDEQGFAVDEQEIAIREVRDEVSALTKQLNEAREELEAFSSQGGGPGGPAEVADSSSSLALDPEEGVQVLSVQCVAGIEMLMLHCTCPAELSDCEGGDGILSRCPHPPGITGLQECIFTYRCRENSTRVQLVVDVREGRSGTLTVFTVPKQQPKAARVQRHRIAPLSLHQHADELEEARPYSELRILGHFSAADAHAWCAQLAAAPDTAAAQPGVIMLRHCMLSTGLRMAYANGVLTFHSDNLTTLAVARDFITGLVTDQKQRVQISIEVHPQAVPHLCALIWPRFEMVQALQANAALVEALQEIRAMDGTAANFHPDHLDVLEHADAIKRQLERMPAVKGGMVDMLRDLHVSYHRFMGSGAPAGRQRLLQELLNSGKVTRETLVNAVMDE
ncbi:unnamed protein product [Pedinophyceae sp. YPF-701]|nr:unnamed protein product [Pedinophyceae sp. YPF-701]